MTPRQLILGAAQRFRDAGVPDPLWDAAQLLAHVTGREALALRLDDAGEVSASDCAAYESLCARRAARVPLQHLLGTAFFCGREFEVTPDVLIPRPETEILVREALSAAHLCGSSPILDLCCGSGCIAITLSLALGCPVDAADLSGAALSVARRNASRLGAQIRCFEGDLFAALPPGESLYGVIASNPPYIPTADCAGLQPEVLHDPMLALDGGADGLRLIRRITAEAPAHLRPGGALLMEIGSGQGPAAAALLRDGGFGEVRILPDEAGLDRIAAGRLTTR